VIDSLDFQGLQWVGGDGGIRTLDAAHHRMLP
jgi:hypothetical protein